MARGTVSFVSAGPDSTPDQPYQVIHPGGEAAAIVPLADLRRLRALERHAPPEALDEAELEVTHARYRQWVATGLPDGGFCRTGAVVPYGQATEMIAFGAGCGGGCDLRTVSVAGGTLVMNETFSNSQCPGSCHPNPAEPDTGSLTDVIVRGTGIFSGATGVLTGTVTAAGPQSHVQLSGTITLSS
jgi:hypothetical protein